MKNKWRLLKILLTIIIFSGLLYFSLNRFSEKKVEDIAVIFVHQPNTEKVYFLDEKKIIDFVKSKNPTGKIGEIDVPLLEKEINSFPSVDSANVYLNLNGKLNINILQRVPSFRLSKGEMNYYVDTKGREFPISKNYSHDVILVSGNVKREEYKQIISLIKKINEDSFAKKYYIGIVKEKENNYLLIPQDGHFIVELGDLENIDFKLAGFKTFMSKYLQYQNPEKYSKISLKFDNQIVTTYKTGYTPDKN